MSSSLDFPLLVFAEIARISIKGWSEVYIIIVIILDGFGKLNCFKMFSKKWLSLKINFPYIFVQNCL